MGRIGWCAAVLLTLAAPIRSAANGPLVAVAGLGVEYRGVTRGSSVEEFNSVKFAKDTSGPRRFAPPQPYLPPKGSVVDARAAAPACPQIPDAIPPYFGATPHQSEDCLYLRITRPVGTKPEDRLPVVVHLLGGGVVKGHTQEALFDPIHLVTESASLGKPVIHVALNYRVTIFGFARLPILKGQKSLNAGMRDQRAGFQWVKDHIASFGGDPDKVTSFGLSSGGTFSSLHLMAYGGERGVPFTRAWCMSGPPGTALNMTSDATEQHTRAVANMLGCGGRFAKNEAAMLQCLREVPADRLTQAAMTYSIQNHPPAGLFTFIPSVDDDLIPDRQSALYKAGKFAKGVPMVFGWTHDDGATNAGLPTNFQTEADIKTPIRKNFAHALTDEDYASLFALYPTSDFETEVANYEARRQAKTDPAISVHYFRAARILRDLLFTCSSIDFGSEMTKQSRALDPSFPGVRMYDLNQSMVTQLFRGAGMPWLGIVHGSDIDYLYNNMFPRSSMSSEDLDLAGRFLASFVNFAYTGDPNGQGSSSWPESFPVGSDEGANVQLIGGPWGTGSYRLSTRAAAEEEGSIATEQMQGMQHPLVDSTKYEEMVGEWHQRGQQELERDRLGKRCSFVNGLAEKLGH
ncbi:Carboxylesterase- type B [Apiospora rasikravindrae]|uniref:Carboxylesterase- type B n=1 Tax=Apiospora rasikravindrae TaxID=990691 RepID=A0ABR1SQG9_9PEZI